jgi:acyl-CoA synthetase (NDP forming)
MIASAGPQEYRRAIAAVMTSPEVDAAIVIFTPVDARTADDIRAAIRDGIAAGRCAGARGKPVLACVMAEAGVLAPLEIVDPRAPAETAHERVPA